MSEMFPTFSSNFLHCPKFRVKNMAEGRYLAADIAIARAAALPTCARGGSDKTFIINPFYTLYQGKHTSSSTSFAKFTSLLEPCSQFISLEFFTIQTYP